MHRFFTIILIFFNVLPQQAQVPFTDYQNPFPQTYLGFKPGFDSYMNIDSFGLYMNGQVALPLQAQPLIFKRTQFGYDYKLYPSNPDTRLNSVVCDSRLKHYYAFITTDATAPCGSGGLKVIAINKPDMAALDSSYFCNPIRPSGGTGYFMYDHLYTFSAFSQYYPAPLPATYSKRWNLIRRIDTNLVLKNEVLLGDTSETFETYFLQEAIDTGIILNAYNETEYCPMLMKLDTLGNELWRKNYYTSSQIGGCSMSTGDGLMGLQPYKDGYVGLFNLDVPTFCSFYSQSILAKIDKNGNLLKEMQYTTAGDTSLEFYSNLTNYTKRTKFYNILVKTNDGNYASVISDRHVYGFNQHENYIVILDTNLNIIHRSPKLGSLYELINPGLVQAPDSTFYLGGGVVNSAMNGMNTRIYTYKIGGQVGLLEYANEQSFKMYPNPTVNELTVENFEGEQHITIYNNMGQLVYS